MRINKPWTTPWSINKPGEGDIFQAYAAPYDFWVYIDWKGTRESDEPYVAGQVIAATNPAGGVHPGYFTQVVFTRQ